MRLAELVFHRDGRPVGDFRRAWASGCIKVGLYRVVTDGKGHERKVPTRLVHDLRRTAVRNLVRAGVSDHTAMAVTGHRTRSVDEGDLRTAALKVQAYTDAQSTARNVVTLSVRAGGSSG